MAPSCKLWMYPDAYTHGSLQSLFELMKLDSASDTDQAGVFILSLCIFFISGSQDCFPRPSRYIVDILVRLWRTKFYTVIRQTLIRDHHLSIAMLIGPTTYYGPINRKFVNYTTLQRKISAFPKEWSWDSKFIQEAHGGHGIQNPMAVAPSWFSFGAT